MKRVFLFAITAILLAIPLFLWLSFIDTRILGNSLGQLHHVQIIIAITLLLATTGVYTIARIMKRNRIRKWFFIGCYLVTTLPIVVVVAIVGIRQIWIPSRADLIVEYGLFVFAGIVLLLLTVPPVLFAHIAYALNARRSKHEKT